MTEDLSRIRRLAGILNEDHDPQTDALLDQACDCSQPECARCNPEAEIQECNLEESVEEAYKSFMEAEKFVASMPGRRGFWMERRKALMDAISRERYGLAAKIEDELRAAGEFDEDAANLARAERHVSAAMDLCRKVHDSSSIMLALDNAHSQICSDMDRDSIDETMDGVKGVPSQRKPGMGSAGVPTDKWVECEECGGSGKTHSDWIDGHGTGYSTSSECFNCSGEGGWERDEEDEDDLD